MNLAFYLPLAAPVVVALALAAAARQLTDQLEPRMATWLLTGAAAVLAGCLTGVLGLLALGGAARMPLVAGLGRMSLHVLQRDDPVPSLAAVGAAVLLAAIAVSVIRAACAHGRSMVAAWRIARSLRRDGLLVVVPDQAVDAFATPALGPLPGHVVVTAGMLEVLNDCEREVVLAHERAHLTGRHFLFLLTSRLAAAVCPLLIPVATAVAHCVERWADETAAARTGHRRVAAAAIGKAALARQQYGRLATAQWALHAATGSVPRRVAALLMPPQRSRPWLPLVIATVLAAACLAALVPAEHVHEILKAARLSLR